MRAGVAAARVSESGWLSRLWCSIE
jgi:hypothetical protein